MISKVLLIKLLKFVFACTAVTGSAVVISTVFHLKPVQNEKNADEIFLQEYQSGNELHGNYIRCIKYPTKEFCLMLPEKQLVFAKAKKSSLNYNSVGMMKRHKHSHRRHPTDLLINDFVRIMQEFDMCPCLIEPSILFCMLRDKEKTILQQRGLNISEVMGAHNVVNFAISFNDSQQFVQLLPILEDNGFKYYELATRPPKWFYRLEIPTKGKRFITHIFLECRLMVIHLVVFYERQSYYWHAGLNYIPFTLDAVVSEDTLLFAKHASSYDRFIFSPLIQNDIRSSSSLHIPFNATLFLNQIQSSKFIESKKRILPPEQYIERAPKKPIFRFDERSEKPKMSFIEALTITKSVLQRFYIRFFIFGDTLLDWHQKRMNISSNDVVELALFASDLPQSEQFFKQMEELQCATTVLGAPDEEHGMQFNCSDSRINFYFIYGSQNSYYIAGQKFNNPKMEVCSAELLGQRVQVPCEIERL